MSRLFCVAQSFREVSKLRDWHSRFVAIYAVPVRLQTDDDLLRCTNFTHLNITVTKHRESATAALVLRLINKMSFYYLLVTYWLVDTFLEVLFCAMFIFETGHHFVSDVYGIENILHITKTNYLLFNFHRRNAIDE